ncbi:DUF2530 domain-containing protein [Salininema proteolyticum]|uniref:DUF2530 domain-containing protein n=1 Tax=Salininema proteolyticum TaxID=1607685 RepID=A0ABV8TXG6_9ACTN
MTEEELLTPTFVAARYPEKRSPEPARVPMVPVFAVGTALWVIAFIIVHLNREALEASGRGWWPTCAAIGIVIGILGTVTMYVRDRRRRR